MQIKFDKQQLDSVKTLMDNIDRDAPELLARAINKTEDNTQTKAVDLIYQDLNLTKTRIRKDFKKIRAFKANPTGTLDSQGEPVGLASFTGTKELKSGGVSVKVTRTGKRERLKHAFMAQARGSGADHVWERVNYIGTGGRALWWLNLSSRYRYPLKRKRGPRVQDYYAQNSVYIPTENYAAERLQINTASQMDFFLAKYG